MLATAACQRMPDPQRDGLEGTVITFSISVGETERPAILELLRRFEEQSRARVNLQQLTRFRRPLGPQVSLVTDVPSRELARRLEQDAQAGKPTIHIFAQDNVALSELVQKGLVQGLDGLLKVPEEAIDNLIRIWDGPEPRHFLPFRPNVRLTYARTAAFRAAAVSPPKTEDDLVRAAAALKGPVGRAKVTLSLAEGDPAAVTVCELILSHGGNPLVLNDPGSVAAFQFVQRLWREGLLAPASFEAKWDTEVRNLLDGTTALAENWSYTSAELAKEGVLGEFDVYAGWSGPRDAHVIGGDVLGIPTGVKGKQLEAAVALADFLLTKESQELLMKRNAWPSFRNDVDYARLPPDQRSTFAAIETALADGWYRPAVPYWPEVSAQLNRAVTAILLEDRPVQPVLDELHVRIREAAARQGAPYPYP